MKLEVDEAIRGPRHVDRGKWRARHVGQRRRARRDDGGERGSHRADCRPSGTRFSVCHALRSRDQNPLGGLGGALVHRQAVTSRLTSLLI